MARQPWCVTITRHEHILSEGMVYASTIQECAAKLKERLHTYDKPVSLYIESPLSFKHETLERHYTEEVPTVIGYIPPK